MSFILRVFFSGLIAFVPSKDGKELIVLLLNTNHVQHVSDGSTLPQHKPMLLARARSCNGECPTRDTSIAGFLFPDLADAAGVDALAHAADGGAVWELSSSDLSLGGAASGMEIVRRGRGRHSGDIPTSPEDRASFDWVANLKEIAPSVGEINPAVLSANPPAGLIVARLRLRGGKVSTYSMIQISGKVKPIDFRPLNGSGTASYAQAAANWAVAEIRMPGDGVEVLEENFGGGVKRSMTLSPRDGIVEMALLNISQPSRSRMNAAGPPQAGKHFELYWELAKHPLADHDRPVPQAPRTVTAERDWNNLHPATANRASKLLDEILFPGGRGPYDQILCPMSQYPNP